LSFADPWFVTLWLPDMAKNRRPRRVLLLIETSRAYGRGLLEGIAAYARQHGQWTLHFEERGLEPQPPPWLKEWRGDGIISRTTTPALAKMLQATGLPVVELLGDRRIGTARVTCDDLAMGRMALEYLLGCGLQEFAVFAYQNTWWTESHRDGFLRAAAERGCCCHVYRPAQVAERALPVWHEGMRRSVAAGVRRLPRPIGVSAVGDAHAVRLLDVCHEVGLAVPEQLAILSTSNDPALCELVRPTLSSLDLDSPRIGYEAAALLDRMMSGQPVGEETVYTPPSHVAVRQSTDTLMVTDADVVRAIRLIRSEACTGLGVPRLVKEIGISRSILDRRFRQHLGHTPKAEILRVRIQRAKSLLVETDMSLRAVSRQSGFASQLSFDKAFRRAAGMTPTAYRRSRRMTRAVFTEQQWPAFAR
jgi:LacI family transcriptional regulator